MSTSSRAVRLGEAEHLRWDGKHLAEPAQQSDVGQRLDAAFVPGDLRGRIAALTSAIAEALRQRHVPVRTATLTDHAAVAVFTIAYADWVDNSAEDFGTLMQRSPTEFRQAVGGTRRRARCRFLGTSLGQR